MIFVDTSAFFAILSTSDVNHQRASLCWRDVLKKGQALFTDSYVLIESMAIVQKRLGLEKMRQLQERILPLLEIEWVDAMHHNTAIEAVLNANRCDLSLADCSAFEAMHRLGIETAFTFDGHFRERGFSVIP